MRDQRGEQSPRTDLVVGAFARLVEALDRRYPDGPSAITEPDLAITDDMPNMPIMSDHERPPAA